MTHDSTSRPGAQAVRAPLAKDATGLTLGTSIYTLDGCLPIEYLVPGDRIITRDAGAVTLRAVHHRRIITTPVLVSVGSLGFDRPEETVAMLPAQAILVRDWRAQALFGAERALVPIRRLIDKQFIRWDCAPRTLDTFALDFGAEHIAYADGVEVLCPKTVHQTQAQPHHVG